MTEQNRIEAIEAQMTANEAPAPEAAPAEAVQTAETEAPAPSEDAEQSAEDAPVENPEPPELPKAVRRKLSKLTRRLGDRDMRIAELERQLETTRTVGAEKPAAPVVSEGKPKLEDFDFDPEAHAEAMAEWMVDQKLSERETRAKTLERETKLKTSTDAFAAKVPDFFEAVADLLMSADAWEAVYEADDPPAVAYHLANHPEEAQRIAGLSPAAAGRAIARIESQLATPTPSRPRSVTNAPAIAPTVQGTAAATKDVAAMSIEDHRAAIRANRNL